MGTLEPGSRGPEGEIAHSLCLKKTHEDIVHRGMKGSSGANSTPTQLPGKASWRQLENFRLLTSVHWNRSVAISGL